MSGHTSAEPKKERGHAISVDLHREGDESAP
jgi:hypothetical protein